MTAPVAKARLIDGKAHAQVLRGRVAAAVATLTARSQL